MCYVINKNFNKKRRSKDEELGLAVVGTTNRRIGDLNWLAVGASNYPNREDFFPGGNSLCNDSCHCKVGI